MPRRHDYSSVELASVELVQGPLPTLSPSISKAVLLLNSRNSGSRKKIQLAQ